MKMRPVARLLLQSLLTVGLASLYANAAFAAPRVSQASLNLSTCGCPTTFVGPTCREETRWELTKTGDTAELDNPSGELVTYTIHIEQSPSETNLKGSGTIIITNSGEQTAYLSGLVLSLEESCGGCGDAIGPSGQNWHVHRTGALVRGVNCQIDPQNRPGYGIVHSCYGDSADDGSATIVLRDFQQNAPIAFMDLPGIPATLDNDGDGRRDEDGACGQNGSMPGVDDDRDGRIDEDGNCPTYDTNGVMTSAGDAVVYPFEYSFDIRDLVEDQSIVAGDAMRVNLMVTFGGAGDRGNGGASCAIDIDCDGIEQCDNQLTPLTDEWEGDWSNQANGCAGRRGDNVRTVQQRGNFTMPPCSAYCDTVDFSDAGATAEEDCLTIENAWDEVDPNGLIYAAEDGQSLDFELDTTVSCRCGDNMGELESQLEEAEGSDGLVSITCAHPGPGGSLMSYWDCTISGALDASLNTLYDAWCVDIDMTLSPGTTYQAQLVSTYSPEALQFVEFPSNLPNVNWMLNNPALRVGAVIPTTEGCGTSVSSRTITYGDVERAIWAMVEEANSTNGLGSYSDCRVNYLVKQACGITDNVTDRPGDVVGETCPAAAAGSSYEPPCGAIVGVMIVPTNTSGAVAGQVNLLQMPMSLVLDDGCFSCTDSCDTTLVNTATLTCGEDPSLVLGSPATVTTDVTCQGLGPGTIVAGDFCSYTIGGWGAKPCNPPSCNNPGKLLKNNFAALYPSGVTLGNATSGKWSKWTTAAAIEAYLPHGGPSNAYTTNQTNPTTTSAGTFGSQLLGATLNVRFDEAGVRSPVAPPKPEGVPLMKTLVYRDCVDPKILMLAPTVDQVLAWSNDLIDGTRTSTPTQITITMLNQALTVLNEQFDNCELADFMCFEAP